VQTATPDRYRGRVSAAEYVVGVGAVELGNFRGGVLGSLTTPSLSAVIGGASSLTGAAVLAAALPALWRYASPAAAEAGPTDLDATAVEA
jgi:hypothetical protein